MKTHIILLGAVVGILTVGGCGKNVGWLLKPVVLTPELTETQIRRDKGLFVTKKIVVVDVDGLLMNDRRQGMFAPNENPVSLFVEKLDKAAKDRDVKALVLRINSPGGGVTASDIMYRRLRKFREEKNIPVIAVMEDVAASGGYYIACGADTIVAHPTTITGSIGVIVQTVSFAGTMQKLGITAQAVTSGTYKDMGSPLKPLDGADREIIQTMVNEFYERFVNVVAAGRPGLSREKAKSLADGRIYTGEQARKLALVDELGTVDDAIALAKSKCGAKRVKVVMYGRQLGHRSNAYSAANVPSQINLVNISLPALMDMSRPRFLYLWTGGTR